MKPKRKIIGEEYARQLVDNDPHVDDEQLIRETEEFNEKHD